MHTCQFRLRNSWRQVFRLSQVLAFNNSYHRIERELLLVAFFFWYLHKNKSYCRSIPTAPCPEEWSIVYGLQNFMELHLILVPLEYEYSIWHKHSHTLSESLLQIVWPALLRKPTILTFQSRFFPCMYKMRRVKYYELIRIVCSWYIPKVGHKVWIHLKVRSRRNESGFFPSDIHILREWIILISPKGAATTADI